MDQFGQNQFAPGMKSSLFLPDQLIAGTLQLVTDTGIITGGTYKRGTVLGMVTASGKYTTCVKTAEDGSETPVAILVDNVDASSADQNGGLYLMGEFNQNHIIIDTSWTLAAMKTALRPLAIFLKDSTQAPVGAS
ncbi:Bacteriophage lambda head decoration protein D [Klebsiella michiganensis]|uniref:head decoration protein n=1 Tax=Klebsiella TaxID=570 RepID=UPI000FEB77DD|nr:MULTISPECIES: head decoration protein [Klebsiella]HBS6333209.1 head decoration protein [Klebsiella pneumoniae]MDS7732650.1 head decoration protein [Klebsiella oxytoca]QQO67148.1 head decoration protein [Klebsiella michiganensis]RWS82313.1 head decoration protein [Klebsiella michiganensis]TYG24141.1 head decoration protein [Klebsiella grimontii]